MLSEYSKITFLILIFYTLLIITGYFFISKYYSFDHIFALLVGTLPKLNQEKNSNYKSVNNIKDKLCNPFFENITENYFNISGSIYPKFVPPYLNKTLDFHCLNNNNVSQNVILLWTKVL